LELGRGWDLDLGTWDLGFPDEPNRTSRVPQLNEYANCLPIQRIQGTRGRG
jgi:hypothetical protein